MIRADFKIGMRFKTKTSEWQVTDVGWRTVIAIPFRAGWMEWAAVCAS